MQSSYALAAQGRKSILVLVSLLITINVSNAFQSANVPVDTTYFEGTIIFNHSNKGRISAVTSIQLKEHYFKFKAIDSPAFLKEAGVEIGDIIFDTRSLTRARIKHGEKSVEYMSQLKLTKEDKPAVEVTDEWIEILGYKCRKYIVRKKSVNFNIIETHWLWITEDLRIKNPKSHGRFDGWNNHLAHATEFTQGTVLRRGLVNKNGEITAVMEAVEILSQAIDPKEFEVPTEKDGYRITGKH